MPPCIRKNILIIGRVQKSFLGFCLAQEHNQKKKKFYSHMQSHRHVAFNKIYLLFVIVSVQVFWGVIAKPTIEAAYDLTTEYLPSKYSLSLETYPRFSWKVPILTGLQNRGLIRLLIVWLSRVRVVINA